MKHLILIFFLTLLVILYRQNRNKVKKTQNDNFNINYFIYNASITTLFKSNLNFRYFIWKGSKFYEVMRNFKRLVHKQE